MVVVGMLGHREEVSLRNIFDIADSTGNTKIIFYQKGEGQVSTALKNFQY